MVEKKGGGGLRVHPENVWCMLGAPATRIVPDTRAYHCSSGISLQQWRVARNRLGCRGLVRIGLRPKKSFGGQNRGNCCMISSFSGSNNFQDPSKH
jgi:hypothetical protein